MVSLSDLPVELLEKILDGLFEHHKARKSCECNVAPCDCYEARAQTEAPYISAFARLSRTCKLFNVLTARRLYRNVDHRKCWLLVRTLIARQELAQYVKHLYQGETWLGGDGEIPPEVVAYFTPRAPDRDGSRDGRGLHRVTPDQLLDTSNAGIDLLASLCPNLESVTTVTHYAKLGIFCEPNSLKGLGSSG